MSDEALLYKPPRPAPELGPAGRRLWRARVRDTQHSEEELLTVLRACRQEDDNARLEQAAIEEPVYIEGSRGQRIINPIWAELRQGRLNVQRLLAGVTVIDEAGKGQRSSAARRMALARWAGRNGG
jgi:hypothetical protein